ncbi:hypothetical protein DFH28DRAFT_1125133 [Melampsora americana]|nr:hypothetical protein DFH28DRAFT_1125133 [Melampsora americana]
MTPSRIPPQVLLARRRRAICSRLAEQQTNHSLSINLDTAQVQSSGAKGKKQVGANKNKNGDKRKNPATPTPLPKVKKTVSHMDPGLTPTGEGGNRSQVVNQPESSVTSAPGESAKDSVAERSPNEEAKTSGVEGDKENDPDGRSDANPAAGGDQDEEESIKRSAMQSLSFKKKGKKEEGDENLSDTQKMRAVKIKAAREQYDEVRAIHDELSKSVKKLEERARGCHRQIRSCCREPGALKTRTQLLEFRRTRHFGGLWTGYMEKEGFWSPLKWQVRRTPESVYGKTAILASAEMASSAEAILGSAEMACSAEARMGYMKKQPFWLPPKWQVRLKPFWAPPKWHVRLKPEWVYGKTSILASAKMTSSAEGNRVYGKTAILGSAEMASSAEGNRVYGKTAILASAEMASSAEGIRVYGKTAILESAEMASSAEARMAIWKNSNSGLR